jgi:hypothetical protein
VELVQVDVVGPEAAQGLLESIAASTTALVPARSTLRPKLLQPSPATDTISPESPSDLYRIGLPTRLRRRTATATMLRRRQPSPCLCGSRLPEGAASGP